MILQIGDWTFDIDITRTMEYSAAEAAEHCTCAYCRNFYASVDEKYPNLRPFLAQFGLDIEAPDEMLPFDGPQEMWYENVYSVSGRIISGAEHTFTVDGVEVRIYSENKLHINQTIPKPHFFIGVGIMVLPWVLDEPMEGALSAANEPSFLKKMWDRLLSRRKKDHTPS